MCFSLLPSLLVNITQIVNTAIRSRAQAHTVSAPSAQQSDQNTVLLSQLAGIKAPATSQTHNTIWWQNLVHAWHATNMNAHIGTTYPHDKTSVNICAQGPHALIAGTYRLRANQFFFNAGCMNWLSIILPLRCNSFFSILRVDQPLFTRIVCRIVWETSPI